MRYFSHSKTGENGEVTGTKLLKDHIAGVKQKAVAQLYEGVQFELDNKELQNLLQVVVDFHDLGKYTSYFQDYLLGRGRVDNQLKQHSRFGGYGAYQRLRKTDQKQALTALYLIFHHHLQLIDITDLPKKLEYDSQKVFEYQLADVKPNLDTISNELAINDLATHLHFPDSKKIRREVRRWVKKDSHIADYFLINYLFSLLIEADKLDASETSLYSLKEMDSHWVDKRFGNTELSAFQNLTDLDTDALRNYCRAEVISHLQDEDILGQHLFTLTAPTGTGKTMTALDFSLKLKAKLRRERNHEAQIIYALPFINIIEQAIDEYEITLQEEDVRILGHYQFADVFGIQQEPDENDRYHQKLMKLDTWQGDMVITSFVQFFETVISNRNKLLKKFNHLAGSIIILDEVQTLRLDQMPLIGAVLYYLAEFMEARIIMMTATKPKIFALAEQEILNAEGESVEAKELLSSHQEVFALFERTAVHPILDTLDRDEEKSRQFVEEVFSKKWQGSKSCITVCNTVNRSIELYEEIKSYLATNRYNNPVFYLSTNILPADRMQRIKRIKESIKRGENPVLVATQVVEAGVDLDFDMGFRDIGPVDSLIQVAGRINRNNDEQRRGAPLYIVDFGECQKIYGALTYQQAKKALSAKQVIPEKEYLHLIEQYFDNISNRSSFRSSRKYFESMKALKYDSNTPKEDFAVSAFRIIEESDIYRPVFIEQDERASLLREKYLQKIKGDISREEFDRSYKMEFQQHIISVPHYYAEDLLPINEFEENMLAVSLNEVEEYYSKETGFIRERETESVMMF
jgi:CRISPR-associated endonuclease/helicase Cas3